MTDFVLRSTDQAAMYAAFTELGIMQDGVLRTQGELADGTQWALVDQGSRSIQIGTDPDGNPVYTTDEYWAPLRWNGGAPTPPVPPEITVVWRSDDDTPYPEGVTRFA